MSSGFDPLFDKIHSIPFCISDVNDRRSVACERVHFDFIQEQSRRASPNFSETLTLLFYLFQRLETKLHSAELEALKDAIRLEYAEQLAYLRSMYDADQASRQRFYSLKKAYETGDSEQINLAFKALARHERISLIEKREWPTLRLPSLKFLGPSALDSDRFERAKTCLTITALLNRMNHEHPTCLREFYCYREWFEGNARLLGIQTFSRSQPSSISYLRAVGTSYPSKQERVNESERSDETTWPFPPEVTTHILSFLEGKDLASMRKVSRGFNVLGQVALETQQRRKLLHFLERLEKGFQQALDFCQTDPVESIKTREIQLKFNQLFRELASLKKEASSFPCRGDIKSFNLFFAKRIWKCIDQLPLTPERLGTYMPARHTKVSPILLKELFGDWLAGEIQSLRELDSMREILMRNFPGSDRSAFHLMLHGYQTQDFEPFYAVLRELTARFKNDRFPWGFECLGIWLLAECLGAGGREAFFAKRIFQIHALSLVDLQVAMDLAYELYSLIQEPFLQFENFAPIVPLEIPLVNNTCFFNRCCFIPLLKKLFSEYHKMAWADQFARIGVPDVDDLLTPQVFFPVSIADWINPFNRLSCKEKFIKLLCWRDLGIDRHPFSSIGAQDRNQILNSLEKRVEILADRNLERLGAWYHQNRFKAMITAIVGPSFIEGASESPIEPTILTRYSILAMLKSDHGTPNSTVSPLGLDWRRLELNRVFEQLFVLSLVLKEAPSMQKVREWLDAGSFSEEEKKEILLAALRQSKQFGYFKEYALIRSELLERGEAPWNLKHVYFSRSYRAKQRGDLQFFNSLQQEIVQIKNREKQTKISWQSVIQQGPSFAVALKQTKDFYRKFFDFREVMKQDRPFSEEEGLQYRESYSLLKQSLKRLRRNVVDYESRQKINCLDDRIRRLHNRLISFLDKESTKRYSRHG